MPSLSWIFDVTLSIVSEDSTSSVMAVKTQVSECFNAEKEKRSKKGDILLPVRVLTKICMTSVQIDMG